MIILLKASVFNLAKLHVRCVGVLESTCHCHVDREMPHRTTILPQLASVPWRIWRPTQSTCIHTRLSAWLVCFVCCCESTHVHHAALLECALLRRTLPRGWQCVRSWRWCQLKVLTDRQQPVSSCSHHLLVVCMVVVCLCTASSANDETSLALEAEAIEERMEAHARRIVMVFGMITDCLSVRVLAHNLHLVYALLHSRQLVDDCVAFGEDFTAHVAAVRFCWRSSLCCWVGALV